MQLKSGLSLSVGCLLCLQLYSSLSCAQVSEQDTVSLDVEQLFQLVITNNPTLRVAKANVLVAEQAVEVAKNSYLPSADASVSAFYLGDADIFSSDFSTHTKQEMPHFGNAVGAEVQQLLWKGGQIRESVKLSALQEDIASLQYTSSEQQAKLAALGYYLDLYKLYNQSNVYVQNIELANRRLRNINSMFREGMVTRNDVIRAELQVSNLNLDKLVIENNIAILNRQFNAAVGLPENAVVKPAGQAVQQDITLDGIVNYQQTAKDLNPNILLTKKSIDVSYSSLNLAKKNMYPSMALFAGNNLSRPITNITPALDMYVNTWNAGVALSYDIGSLWKNNKLVKQRQLEIQKAEAQQREVEAMIDVAVNAAYIRHNEAIVQSNTLEKNKELADENYRIMENKYNNQLAIIIDLIDASNAKLDAELQYANAEINIIYAYYKLLKETGQL